MKVSLSALLIILLSCILARGFSQPNLVLSKPGSTKHYFYQVGDRFSYRDRVSGEKHSGVIIILNDSTVELSRAPRINIANIDRIYRTRHFLAQSAGAGVVVLGIYFPISVINRAIQQQHPIIDDDMLIVNGTMLAVSGVSWVFLIKRLKIGDPWKLQVLDFGKPIYD
ncbi:MAG: hypothetical protein IPH84_09030 [Bacteroidales bacterium]|nr:hypothetical protein [Bacteroidales bacterium]